MGKTIYRTLFLHTNDVNVLTLSTASKEGSIDHVEKWKMNSVLSNGMPRSGLYLVMGSHPCPLFPFYQNLVWNEKSIVRNEQKKHKGNMTSLSA